MKHGKSHKQTDGLVSLWMRRPITRRNTVPTRSGAGTLFDADDATIGRWGLTQDRHAGTGQFYYVLTPRQG